MSNLLPEEIKNKLPPLHSTESEKDPLSLIRFYHEGSGFEWYGQEYDHQKRLFFGIVFGYYYDMEYFSLDDLELVDEIKRDINFKPTPLSQIRKEHEIQDVMEDV